MTWRISLIPSAIVCGVAEQLSSSQNIGGFSENGADLSADRIGRRGVGRIVVVLATATSVRLRRLGLIRVQQ